MNFLFILIFSYSLPSGSRGADTKDISKAIQKLDNSLRSTLNPNENILYSPTDIFLSLLAIFVGSSNSSSTRSEIKQTLRLPDTFQPSKDDLHSIPPINMLLYKNDSYVSAVKRLYANKNVHVKAEYSDVLQKLLSTDILNVDFIKDQANLVKDINGFVKKETKGRLANAFNHPLNNQSLLSIVSAVAFEGEWGISFVENATKVDNFTNLDGTKVKIEMMHLKDDFRYLKSRVLGAAVVEIPYGQHGLSLVVYVPDQSTEMDRVSKKLNNYNAPKFLVNQRVYLYLPKFSLASAANLREPLSRAGIQSAFQPKKANLAEIAQNNGSLSFTEIVHAAGIRIKEKGVTQSKASQEIDPPEICRLCNPPVLKANKPFWFQVLHQKTGIVLLSGRYVKHTTP